MSIRSEFVRLWNEFMASAKKITQLTALPSPVTTGDLLEVVRGGQNYKADGSQLPSGGGGGTWGSITGTLSAQTDLQAALDAKESLYRVFDRKTANYPLVLADGLKGIEMNVAGANTVTVPLNATQAFPVGTLIPVVQYGAGLTSIVFTGGVTSRSSSGNLDSPGQYSPMFLRKIATDEWYLWNGTAGGGAVSSVFTRTGAVIAAANDYSADQITNIPTGGISAIDVQGAIDELDAFRPTFDEVNALTRGIQDLFISAAAMWPRTTGPCADLAKTEIATSLFNIQSLDFDQTTQEFCQFQIVLPRKWDRGTVTAVFYWTAAAGSGTVQWGISGGAYSNDDALTVALGSAQTADDTLIATNDLHISPETSAITLAGTPADADFLAFQVSRNPGSDTLSADAKLLGVSIRITTDSAIDA